MSENSTRKAQSNSEEEWIKRMKRLAKEHPVVTESEDGFLILDGPRKDYPFRSTRKPEEPSEN